MRHGLKLVEVSVAQDLTDVLLFSLVKSKSANVVLFFFLVLRVHQAIIGFRLVFCGSNVIIGCWGATLHAFDGNVWRKTAIHCLTSYSCTRRLGISFESEHLAPLSLVQSFVLASFAALSDAKNANAANCSANNHSDKKHAKELVDHLLESHLDLHLDFLLILCCLLSGHSGLLRE